MHLCRLLISNFVRKFYLCLFSLFTIHNAAAQWKPVSLNYNHQKRHDFFTPVALHFSDTANGFILNSNELLQWKNNFWQPVNAGLPEEFSYTSIFTVNPRNTFLCGFDGKVAKFNGDTLAVLFTLQEPEVASPALNVVCMIDSANGWAAGENGTLIRFNSSGYSIENQPPTYSFTDMYFDTPEHGWMIGYVSGQPDGNGVVFEYKNGFWGVHSTLSGRLYDVEFSSPGHGFITGENDIYKFDADAEEWHHENIQGYYRQFHLSMLNDNYGISVSDNSSNMVYNNGSWSAAQPSFVTGLFSIKTLSEGRAWAISQLGTSNPLDLNEGKIQLMQDNAWPYYSIKYLDSVLEMPLDVAVTSINGIGKKSLWFNGLFISVPEEKIWPDDTPVLASDTFCNPVKMYSDSFGLGLSGDLYEWFAGYWFSKNIGPIGNPDTSVANICMHAFADTTGFICRQLFAWSSGEIKNTIDLYSYNNNSLAQSAVLGTRAPNAIHFSGKRNGWCVGDSGLLVKYNYEGANWEIMPTVTYKRLTTVFTVDSANAWAAGDEGILLYYNGTEWLPQPLGTEQNLHQLYFTDKNNGWCVGDSGLIFRYNGGVWARDTSGTTTTLYSIYMADSAFGFAGGENGTVLQFSKPAPPVPAEKMFCEFGNTWYTYRPQGDGIEYSFQWQADNGSGFENIDDNAIFAGANTDSLVLTAMPSYLYGWRFRCIASHDGADSISTEYELKFINRWVGTVSKLWEDSGNWSCGAVPGENTDVMIEAGEVIISSSVSIRSLSARLGVNILVADGAALNILK